MPLNSLKEAGATGATSPATTSSQTTSLNRGPANVIVVGCAALDVVSAGKSEVNATMLAQSTIPGTVKLTLGGVARNISEAASRMSVTAYPGSSSLLVAPIGKDFFGHILAERTAQLGMRNDGLVPLDDRTAVCNMVLDGKGALVGGISDMGITDDFTFEAMLPQLQGHSPRFVCFDGNLSADVIKKLTDYCHEHKIEVLCEPTSVYKTGRIMPTIAARINEATTEAPVTHFTPNLLELQEIYEQVGSEDYDLMSKDWWWKFVDKLSLGTSFRMDVDHLARRPVSDVDDSKGKLTFLTEQGVVQRAVHLLPFFRHIWVKCGEAGVLAVMHLPAEKAASSGFANLRSNMARRCVVAHGMKGDIVVVKHFPSLPAGTIENVTGAGDSLVGALVAGIASDDKKIYSLEGLESVVNTAQHAAVLTLQSHEAVSPLLSKLKKL